MRAYLVPVALAASISLAPAAFAATAHSATGAIKSYDAKAHSITLADGSTYMLPSSFKGHLKAGEKVQISWVMKGESRDATQMKVLK